MKIGEFGAAAHKIEPTTRFVISLIREKVMGAADNTLKYQDRYQVGSFDIEIFIYVPTGRLQSRFHEQIRRSIPTHIVQSLEIRGDFWDGNGYDGVVNCYQQSPQAKRKNDDSESPTRREFIGNDHISLHRIGERFVLYFVCVKTISFKRDHIGFRGHMTKSVLS